MESGRVKIAKYNHEFADDKHQCPVTDMVSMAKSIGNERGHKFNDLQACAWASCVLQKKSVFLSGGAGVGKSFIMKSIASYVAENHKPGSVLVCAPTGTAALVASSACLKGCTLHRAFGIQRRNKSELGNQDKLVIKLDLGPPYDTNLVAEEDGDIYEDERNTEMISSLSERQMNTLEEVKLLVIDECSMVSKEMILLVDYVLRRVNDKAGMPFGGVQVLAVGDFLQLEPIVKDPTLGVWAFEAVVWSELNPVVLKEVVRQKGDQKFVEVLNRGRVGESTLGDMRLLGDKNQWRSASVPAGLYIVPRRADCKRINDVQLIKVPGAEFKLEKIVYCEELYDGKFHRMGDEDEVGMFIRKRAKTTDTDVVVVRVGCRIRCNKNVYRGWDDPNLLVANGERGTLVSFDGISMMLLLDEVGDIPERRVCLTPVSLRKRLTQKSPRGNAVRKVTESFPVDLGYAITIHSAQGSTIMCAVDIDPVFKYYSEDHPGRGRTLTTKPAACYVALSRIRRLKDVRFLKVPRLEDVVCNSASLSYYKRVEKKLRADVVDSVLRN